MEREPFGRLPGPSGTTAEDLRCDHYRERCHQRMQGGPHAFVEARLHDEKPLIPARDRRFPRVGRTFVMGWSHELFNASEEGLRAIPDLHRIPRRSRRQYSQLCNSSPLAKCVALDSSSVEGYPRAVCGRGCCRRRLPERDLRGTLSNQAMTSRMGSTGSTPTNFCPKPR